MYVTLNITAKSIRLLSVKGRQVEKWGSVALPPGLVKDGLILQPKVVGSAISALLKSAKVPKQRIIASLTGMSFTYRILSLPRTKPALLEEAIQRSARREIPLPVEELYLSWQAINGGHDDELDVFVLGVPRNLINAIIQTLKEAGVESYVVDLKPLALARAANRGDALIVDLEPDCFDVVLVANGTPTVLHTITPRGEGANLEDNIRRLTDELSKTVKFYNSSHPQTPLSPTTPLLLTGELASANTSKLIQAEIEYPVKPLVPPLELPPTLPVAPYAANIGLALKKAPQKTAAKGEANGFHDINLNILADKYRVKARSAPRRKILLPLALIAAIGLLFGLYQVNGQAEAETMRQQNVFGTLSQELRQARLALDAAKQTENTINEILADVEALKQEHGQILGKRGDLSNTLELITNALPPSTYFTAIKIDTKQITVGGETDSPSKVISYADALENQAGFAGVRIAKIDEGNTAEAETATVSFSIVISK